ncbi:MAG: ATP-dependent Clp protease adaptor ClpS [Fimbriimonadaceae bacterium]|jgi:ATP-dependent Clp protease adapter protein ClpS|nr:ATP-dependent Clp protease adaptor ClpS [Fimbriimonadaceae bacterium]
MSNPNVLPELSHHEKTVTERYMVVIFNNDTTEMDDVVCILMEATGCDVEEAYIEMWEAHHFGKAPVHFDGKEECERAAKIINRVGVETVVCREWND